MKGQEDREAEQHLGEARSSSNTFISIGFNGKTRIAASLLTPQSRR